MANNATDVMRIAANEIGYCRFDDPQTGTKYGRWYATVVNDKGYAANGVAFCAMFVSWCMNQAGATSAVTPEAYCPYMVKKGKAAGVTVSKSQARYGDIVLFDWENDGVSDHVGFVESNNGSYLTCIEGNTTGADGRSGSVARRTRAYSTVCLVVRPNYGAAAQTPGLDLDTVAQQVIDGKWGNGDDRRNRLKAAGYDPDEVQKRVNAILNGTSNIPSTQTKLQGVDIYSGDTGIDFARVPADFVIVKATGGVSYRNSDLTRGYTNAKQNGKLLGLYHYAREKNRKGSAKEEAQWFIDNVKEYIGEAILVLDWEEENNLGTGWAKEWLDYVYKKTGVKPLIYMSKSVCREFNWTDVKNAGYELWAAQYANMNQTGYQSNPWTDDKGWGAWSGPILYQYSATGRLNGWNGDLDLNIFYGTKDKWNELAGVTGPTGPELRHDIQVWDFNGTNAQRWFCRVNSDGTYSFRNASNWLWLSDPNSSTVQTDAQLWGGAENPDSDLDDPREPQKLILEEIDNGPIGKIYNIHPKVAPNLSLDVSNASADAGAKVQWYPTNGTVAQQWALIFKDGAYFITNPSGMKCLDAPNGGYWV